MTDTPETYPVQQYTGLKDKNGVKIHEGDIVTYKKKNREIRIGQYSNGEDDRIGCFIQDPTVTHKNFGSSKISDFRECEVIGNIFENSELLESCENKLNNLTVTEQRDRLLIVIEAATILIAAKGRHNTMLAYNGLRDALQSTTLNKP